MQQLKENDMNPKEQRFLPSSLKAVISLEAVLPLQSFSRE